MLHNSGPYRPGETPVNAAATLTMPQNARMSSPLNIGHNLSNLGKIAQSSPQMPSGQHNITDYSNYSHHSLNLGSQMSSFTDFPPAAFPPSFLPSNQPSAPNNNWQNGFLPTNFNLHSSQAQNMANFPLNFERGSQNHQIDNESSKPPCNTKPSVLNIPQVPFKTFQKNYDLGNCGLFNLAQDKFDNFLVNCSNDVTIKEVQINSANSPENQVNVTIEQTKQIRDDKIASKAQHFEPQRLMDDLKRKSLENTVRLIEDILISTEKNKQSKHTGNKAKSKKQLSKTADSKTDKITEVNSEKTETKTTVNSITEITITPKESDLKNNVTEKPISITLQCEQTLKENMIIKEENLDPEIDFNTTFDIKIEPLDFNTDHLTPFQRDLNGCTRDELREEMIIDCDNSVTKAMEAIGSGTSTSCYECPNCNLVFKHPKRFLIHTKWHTFGLTFEKRQDVVKEREFLRNQKKEAKILQRKSKRMKKDEDNNKNYYCKECDRTFFSKGSMKNHKQRLHPTKLRECHECGMKMYGWMAMKNHLATHNAPTAFNCNLCDKSFKHKHSLNKHKDTHLEKTVSCPQCPKLFGSENQMKIHQKVHQRAEQGQTYTCSDCGKGFFQSYSLVIHERSHRNEKPYNCTICDTGYATNSSLKRHLKVSHNTTKPFECSTCKRCFNTENIRNRHEVRVHGAQGLLTVECEECDRKFLKVKDLRKHISQEHQKRRRRKRREKKEEDSDIDDDTC